LAWRLLGVCSIQGSERYYRIQALAKGAKADLSSQRPLGYVASFGGGFGCGLSLSDFVVESDQIVHVPGYWEESHLFAVEMAEIVGDDVRQLTDACGVSLEMVQSGYSASGCCSGVVRSGCGGCCVLCVRSHCIPSERRARGFVCYGGHCDQEWDSGFLMLVDGGAVDCGDQ
jgi:hypothetical protein